MEGKPSLTDVAELQLQALLVMLLGPLGIALQQNPESCQKFEGTKFPPPLFPPCSLSTCIHLKKQLRYTAA